MILRRKIFYIIQIVNNNYPAFQLIANTSKIKIPEYFHNFNISNFKNETINFEINLTTSKMDDIKQPISLLIFFSDYYNLFVLNPSEKNYLHLYTIKSTYFIYIYIQILLKIQKNYTYTLIQLALNA